MDKQLTCAWRKDGGIESVKIIGDEYDMNWVECDAGFGTLYGKSKLTERRSESDGVFERYEYYGLTVNVKRYIKAGHIISQYEFINETDADIDMSEINLGINVSFNDNYESAAVCKTRRAHEHIWCGEDSAYIAAKRMGAVGGNVGLIVTSGRIDGYSVERGWNSNDRGDVFFLLKAGVINAGTKIDFGCEIFGYSDFDDFYKQACALTPRFIHIDADKYSVQAGEKICADFRYSKDCDVITDAGKVRIENGTGRLEFRADGSGEKRISVKYGEYETFFEIYVHSGCLNEIDYRLNFIIDKQQVKTGRLKGAIMLYDNEEERQYAEIRPMNDRNLARERMGMVIGMMERAKLDKDMTEEYREKLMTAIRMHIDFIDANIVRKDGKVCESPKYRCAPFYHRLYNYSWAMLLYVTAYELFREERFIIKACNIARTYYKRGGGKFYAINLPFKRITDACESANQPGLKQEMTGYFLRHGDNVIAIGTDWPAHEVKYEQSIVAPSVDILLECYMVSGDKKYLDEAERQLPLLEAFNGVQPSFHNNEISIRHWDGFWFGKRKMYGDTFPHYWSCITAGVFSKYAAITGKAEYAKRADKCLNNNLCLIGGGKGACAYLMPRIINGNKGSFYDPWANDQDWLIWFNLRYNSELNKI